MRLLRLTLPIVGLLVMMFAEGNKIALYIAYGFFAATVLAFAAGFVGEARSRRDSD